MRLLPFSLLLAFVTNYSVFAAQPSKRSYNSHNYYVLEHDPSIPYGASLADVASALGVEVIEQAGQLTNHWLVRAEKSTLQARAEDEADTVLNTFEQLKALAQSHSRRSEVAPEAHRIVTSLRYLSKQQPRQRVKRAPPPVVSDEPLSASRAFAERFGINDPLFSQQWHLVNDENPEHMMNVTPIWEMGITGKGVIAAMVDDGVDYTSEDLKENFDAVNSWDYNDHDALPTPKLFDDHHGTRCAGQIAAGKNNACGMGIAYQSKIAGIRILSGPISDVDEAAALNHGFQNVSIYSCSWGPPDNGKSMEGPSYLIQKAFFNGINRGRGGKGSIFVFASGNGASYGDQCNYDGFTNGIYSVTVSAIDYRGAHPYYSEPCAANMIVAYSSGGGKHIVTTDKGQNACSDSHGGTSAAAPNAAGVFALALEARPDLTWRDIQHLCVQTARKVDPSASDWEKTASGRLYSYKYGYGVLDASRFIVAAKEWQLALGPSGIKSVLGVKREHDSDKTGYPGWTFMTVKHWGENPVGEWTLRVSDQANPEHSGSFLGWNMMFWGSVIADSRTVLYELPLLDDVFPPLEEPHNTSIKQHPKPTVALAPTEGTSEDATSTITPQVTLSSGSSTASSTPAPDEGLFPPMTDLVFSQRWVFVASSAVVFFAIGTGIFFWRRRAAYRIHEQYAYVPDDEVAMGHMLESGLGASRGGPRTTELCDPFGEVSDNEDTNEETRLHAALHQERLRDDVGHHSGFLGYEEPTSVGQYCDHPNNTSDLSCTPSIARSPDVEQVSKRGWQHAF